jgi:predicted glycoside hydrolase/deacetylase ChbG (UPF0249 family)
MVDRGMKYISLIFNADDFGHSTSENAAIAATVVSGPVRSVTVLANFDEAGDITGLKRKVPALGAGVHINLTEGHPVLEPHAVESIVSKDGTFFPKIILLKKIFTGAVSFKQVELEVKAQIEKVGDLVGGITHADSHQNIHIVPGIMAAVVRACKVMGVKIIRGQKEIYLTDHKSKNQAAGILINHGRFRNVVKRLCQVNIEKRGLISPALLLRGMPGYMEPSSQTEAIIAWWREMLPQLPGKVYEVVLHPGFSPAEVSLLVDKRFHKLLDKYHCRSISFASLNE